MEETPTGTVEGAAEQSTTEVAPTTGSQEVQSQEKTGTEVKPKESQFDPKAWVTQNIEKPASEWNVPQEHIETTVEELRRLARENGLRQSDYSKKMEEFRLKEQQLSQWNDQRLEAEVQKPEFQNLVVNWLQKNGYTLTPTNAPELTPEEQAVQAAIKPVQDQLKTVQQHVYQERLAVEKDKLVKKYGEDASKVFDEIEQMRYAPIRHNQPLSHEAMYKIQAFDSMKENFEKQIEQVKKEAEEKAVKEYIERTKQKINAQPVNGLHSVGTSPKTGGSFSETTKILRSMAGG